MEDSRFNKFSDKELYLLHRHAVESSHDILALDNEGYSKEERAMHMDLLVELSAAVNSRTRHNMTETRIVRRTDLCK